MNEHLRDYLQKQISLARFSIDLADRFLKTAVEDKNYSMAVYWDTERQKAEATANTIMEVAKICGIELA